MSKERALILKAKHHGQWEPKKKKNQYKERQHLRWVRRFRNIRGTRIMNVNIDLTVITLKEGATS